jgi:hypothetical protein
MRRTPSSRDGGLAATSETEQDARSTMSSTTTAACDSATTAASMVLMKGRSLVDSKGSNSENNSNNGDESGYGSDSSPDSSGDGDGADSNGCDNDDEYEDGGDMQERIYFLREKQLLMERAGNVLSRRAERNYAAAVASDLCRGLTTESSVSASSSCGSSSSSGEEDAEKSGLKKKRKRGATTSTTSNINIWIEAKRVLSEMNKKGSGYDDECSGPILPVPTSIYRKRCAPTPIHPLIDHRIVQRVRSKLYDAESGTGTGQALLGSPFAPSNQV